MNMLQNYSPVGKFIFLTYKHPEVLAGDAVLKNGLGNLMHSLKAGVKTYGLMAAQQKMEDELFNLRFGILEYLSAHPHLLGDIEATIIEQIGEKYFTAGKFKELGSAISDTLEVYLLMFGNLAGEIKNKLPLVGSIPANVKQELTLSSLRHINALQPNPELSIVIEWFSASVRYDFFLIAAEFILNKEIEVDEDQIKLLASSLKKAIVDFGVYTILSGLWQPKDSDESQLIRNIKIKVTAYKMNAGLGRSIALNDLKNLLLA